MNAYEQLSDPDEAFSDASFEDFGLDDVFGGGLFAFFEINVFCNNVCHMLGKMMDKEYWLLKGWLTSVYDA